MPVNAGRFGSLRRKATAAGWPFPEFPGTDATPEVRREWVRLYRRLRWTLGSRVDAHANVRLGARLARLKYQAKQRGIECTLTEAQYVSLLAEGCCAYCGGGVPKTGHGVDRMDSRLGYHSSNVVLACEACNRIKSDIFSYEQMVEIGKLIVRWREMGTWSELSRSDGRNRAGRPPKAELRAAIEAWNRRHGT